MRRRGFVAGGLSAGLAGRVTAAAAPPVALCLGISRYQNAAPLPSAVRDAALMGRRFRALGFHTDVVRDASQREVLVALARWRLRAKGAGIAVIYVAAHGVLSGGQTRFFPADAAVQMAEAGLPEHLLIRAVSDVPRHKVLFLDCCRGGDFGGAALPAVALPAGVHITYAAQPQAPAYDGEQYNSPFAQALDQALARPGQSLEQVARQTRLSVLRNTGGAQVPWSRSSLLLPLVLNNGGITN